MKKVIFVCLGNICRSTMAEAIMRSQVNRHKLTGQIYIDSAGTSNWEAGSQPHQGTRKILDREKIDYSGIIARQITQQDFKKFDYIIGMDLNNIADLKRIAPKEDIIKIRLFLDVLPGKFGHTVPDPYYTGDFEETFQLVQKGVDGWMKELLG